MARGSIAVALALLAGGSCRPPADQRPGVILLMVDTLRADHLGTYGFPGAISPALDALAAESFVFERCFANAPWTPPSVATLFTSLYPQVHGLDRFAERNWVDPATGAMRASVLPEDALTLAEVLRDAGFATAAIVANPWLEHSRGLNQGFELYDDLDVGNRTPATVITSAASDWFDGRPSGGPFFLYLHFMDVHEPYDSPQEDFLALRAAAAAAAGADRELAESERPPVTLEVPAPWADERMRGSLAYWRTRYAAGVRKLDRRVTGLLDRLRETGVLETSWVIVTADHGEELFEHGGWSHGHSLHDYQLRVPLVIRPPGGLPAARRIDATVRLIDLMPTILSLAGVAHPSGMQGRDVAGLFDAATPGADAPVFSTGVVGSPGTYAVRTERFKLIADLDGGAAALFDLTTDAGETVDVAAEHPAVVAELLKQIEAHVATTSAVGGLRPLETILPSSVRERLEALGYAR